MSGQIVNLRQARKRRDRQNREAEAERNRFEYGRSKSERDLAHARNEKARRDLDGGWLEVSGENPDATPER